MKLNLKMSLLDPNTGQIDGLPGNPRHIKDKKFEDLKQSIIDDPEMLEHRGLLVYPLGKKYILIGGNMRFLAIKEVAQMPASKFNEIVESKKHQNDFLAWFAAITLVRDKKEIPCEVLDSDTPVSKLRAFVIKDNLGYGEWDHDVLANEWDAVELQHWGLDIPDLSTEDEEDGEEPVKVLST